MWIQKGLLVIRLVLLAIAMTVSSAGVAAAQTRDTYTVRDISVDERAATVMEAQQKAFASARLAGAYRLIDRLTLAEDRSGKLSPGAIDSALAERMAAAVDVEEETRGGGRYVGKLAVVYNPANIRSFLDERDIPYVDRLAPLSVIFPVSDRYESASWAAIWPDRSLGRLAPYVTSRTNAVSADSDWFAMEREVNAAGARRAIKAMLSGSQGAFRVSLGSITAAGETPLGSTRSAATPEEAVELASQALDDSWKEQSIIRSDVRTPARSTVFFTSLIEWNSLRSALARSPLVSDFAIEGLSKEGAVVKFAFAGEEQRLISNLRERGVTLEPDELGWVMTSAVSANPFSE